MNLLKKEKPVEKKSIRFAMNKNDWIRWLLNLAKFVVAPILIYVIGQHIMGVPIDWKLIELGASGAILDLLHKFTKDTDAPY